MEYVTITPDLSFPVFDEPKPVEPIYDRFEMRLACTAWALVGFLSGVLVACAFFVSTR